MVQAPDGRVFVAEKGGDVRIIEDGILLDQPFYSVETETPGERGITGLLLHPDFDVNGYVYIYYTVVDENRNVLIRVQSSGNTASSETEETIFEFDTMWAAWHNGGGMVFDDNGDIIIGVGDGTGWQSAEQMTTTLGKILRITEDGEIPTNNPFYNETDDDQKAIWGIGVRNPYTMAKQGSTGRIFFNDVGNEEWEEVNEVIEGAHYGWGSIEGPIQPGETPPEGYQDPLHAYDHSDGCAIVGATFYEPEIVIFPEEYESMFFFMEHCEGEVRSLDPLTLDVAVFATGFQFPNAILTLSDGAILISEIYNNRILRVEYAGSGVPFVIEQPQDAIAVIGETAEFSLTAGGEGELDYTWYKDQVEIPSSNAPAIAIGPIDIEDNGSIIQCEISNSFGQVSSQEVLLSVLDDSRPQVQILQPASGATYQAGDTLWFSGMVTDIEDGPIDPADWVWDIYFHHNVHRHPALLGYTGQSSGYYVIPDQGEVANDVWFRVELKAVDSSGLESSVHTDVLPEYCFFSVESDPEGIPIKVDGSSLLTGEDVQSILNMKRTLETEEFVIQSNRLYRFKDWGDPSSTSLTTSFHASDTTLNLEYDYLHDYFYGDESEDLVVQYYIGTDENREFHSEVNKALVDGNWSNSNPVIPSWSFPNNDYSVVYIGSILAPYTGVYDLEVYHDGHVQLFLEDSLIMDELSSMPHIDTHSVQTYFEAGLRYNFILDYRHFEIQSRVKLSWSFSELDTHVIPSAQLFGPFSYVEGDYLSEVLVFPNPSTGSVQVDFGSSWNSWISDKGRISIYSVLGQEIIEDVDLSFDSQIGIENLRPGLYFLDLRTEEYQRTIQIAVH
ncbi:MAG: T9SS type A sorting domain-containing protein [Flavobacteriales bacterium]|nr:T9SS type A sorting domain-containing protein [Flavobacteriales bacterium]